MKKIAVILAVGAAFVLWREYTRSIPGTGVGETILTEANLLGAQIMGTPASNMSLSDAGLKAIMQREGFSARKYPDANGYSIGYGHFIRAGEVFTEPMTPEYAAALLAKDTRIAQDAVKAYVKVELTQSQFDALVSFVFNVGAGAFRSSTLLKRLNALDYAGAAAEFDRWHIPSAVIARRDSEKQQFLA